MGFNLRNRVDECLANCVGEYLANCVGECLANCVGECLVNCVVDLPLERLTMSVSLNSLALALTWASVWVGLIIVFQMQWQSQSLSGYNLGGMDVDKCLRVKPHTVKCTTTTASRGKLNFHCILKLTMEGVLST